MRTIHKFSLFRIGQVNEVELARAAIPRRVAMQSGVLCMWAEVETDEPKKVRRFSVIGTGHPIPENGHYIGDYGGDIGLEQEANAKLIAAAPELLALVNRAVAVLQRHAPPDGLSDHDALSELYGIFDGPEYRAAIDKATK